MHLFTASFLLDIVALVITLVIVGYTYFKWSFQYWERKGVPYVPPTIPFGNTDNMFTRKRNLGVILKDLYDELKARHAKFGGFYVMARPQFIPIDPALIKHVLVKDFRHFHERGFFYNEKSNPLSAHIFTVGGAKWSFLRTKLTPTFTSGKMKLMFHTIVECTDSLVRTVDKHSTDKSPIDIKEVLGCFTTDIIGSCAFGLDCKSFEHEDAEFRKYGKRIFAVSPMRILKIMLATSYPNLARKLNLSVQEDDIIDFFLNAVRNNYNYRIKDNIKRNDFFQLLIDIKKECEENGEQFSDENLAALCFLFFIAGFETSSTASTFALYELAKNQELQSKVRDEVKEVLARHNGEVTYEAIKEMKYLRCVLDEALRMYPPLPVLNRCCTEDYLVPDTDVVIEKGTPIVIPVLGLHYDAEYFPEPNTFNPDRFNEENINTIQPYTYLPFGEGPRNCLGLRFGVVQSKVGLAALLSNFKFTLNPKTVQPFRFNPKSFISSTEGEMWLSAERI